MTAITIPNTFLPSTTISSTAMNANFTAVAAALQASLALDGSETMTGQIKAANGSAAAPAFSFGADLNNGIYRKAADELGLATNGTLGAFLDASQKFWMAGAADVAGALSVGGAATLAGNLTLSNTASRTTLAEALAGVGAGFGTITNAAISVGAVDVGAQASHYTNINSGSGPVTSFGSSASTVAPVYLVRNGTGAALTITHGASLVLPGAVNLVLGDSDHLVMRYTGGGVWQCIGVLRSSSGVPTVQSFLSGSGTYTPTPGLAYIEVRMRGAGGGGGGAGGAPTAGGTGADSTFGGWTAKGGVGGAAAGGGTCAGGAGGTAGGNGTGALDERLTGARGGNGSVQGLSVIAPTGNGGASATGGGAGSAGGSTGGAGSPGIAAAANSGSGGGGGVVTTGGGNYTCAAGGGAGEEVVFFMTAAQIGASLSYAVGAAGAAGTGTNAGGAGGAGAIRVREFYL
jgi:hypothetical protein